MGQNGEKKFNSKFDIGSFLVELFAIFQLCFKWEAWGFAMARHRLRYSLVFMRIHAWTELQVKAFTITMVPS